MLLTYLWRCSDLPIPAEAMPSLRSQANIEHIDVIARVHIHVHSSMNFTYCKPQSLSYSQLTLPLSLPLSPGDFRLLADVVPSGNENLSNHQERRPPQGQGGGGDGTCREECGRRRTALDYGRRSRLCRAGGGDSVAHHGGGGGGRGRQEKEGSISGGGPGRGSPEETAAAVQGVAAPAALPRLHSVKSLLADCSWG